MLMRAFSVTKWVEGPGEVNDDLGTKACYHPFYKAQSDIQIDVVIGKLPEIYQVVIQLHDFENLSYSEMVQLLGKSEGTIKCLVHRGRKLLKGFLERESMIQGKIECPSGQKDRSQILAEMAARIEGLPRPYRTILRLHYLEGQSYSEMSQSLEKPKGTIKSLVNRGKKMLFEGEAR
jgi:DNA-directed RNA polymerase specialized sigma24 family protein